MFYQLLFAIIATMWLCLPVWSFAVLDENPYERERGDTKDHPHSQWFINFSEADELLKLAAARQQVTIAWLLSALLINLVEQFIIAVSDYSCSYTGRKRKKCEMRFL